MGEFSFPSVGVSREELRQEALAAGERFQRTKKWLGIID